MCVRRVRSVTFVYQPLTMLGLLQWVEDLALDPPAFSRQAEIEDGDMIDAVVDQLGGGSRLSPYAQRLRLSGGGLCHGCPWCHPPLWYHGWMHQ